MLNYTNKKIIAYACGAGAKIDGCKDAPEYLYKSDLAMLINARWRDIYHSVKKNNYDIITDHCQHLSEDVSEVIRSGDFPIVIGGDHSMAIGTFSGVTSALKAEGEFGLIWFDAHMDSHTPSTSESGAIHGMPLACLLGYGDSRLCSIAGQKPKINPKHVCLIGVRSFEEGEKKLLNDLAIKIYYIDEVRQRGLYTIVEEAKKIVKQNTKAYGVTIDIDAFDPKFAPGTGALEDGGLSADETIEAFKLFSEDKDLKILEIAEYNHYLDKNDITYKLIANLLLSVFSV
jgi:arginase